MRLVGMMLSIERIAAGGAEYYIAMARSPSDDYYVVGEEPGVWVGAGNLAVGREGFVNAGEFRELLATPNPTRRRFVLRGSGLRCPGFDAVRAMGFLP